MDIIKSAKRVEESIINWRRDLHQIPEIGLNLEQTSQYVIKQLEEMGIEYRRNRTSICIKEWQYARLWS